MFGLFKKKDRGQKNDAVRQMLASYGDDGTAVRHVIHYAYPSRRPTGTAQEVLDAIRRIAEPDTIEPTEAQDSIRFEQNREVASADFDSMTDALEVDLKALGWKYDGWECAVETGEQQ